MYPIYKKTYTAVFLIFVIGLFFASLLMGQVRYDVELERSGFKCSVKYLILSKLKGTFEEFSGQILFVPDNISKSSIRLEIETASFKSKKSWLTKIVRSQKLLDVEKFPKITFQSKSIEKKGAAYRVVGVLDLHGVSKEISFPFTLEQVGEDERGQKYVAARGKWAINRKEFEISWNPLLDKGGIIVGNNVIVAWEIEAVVNPLEEAGSLRDSP